MKLIAISSIRLDGGTQTRGGVDAARVAQYAECLDELPPVVVFHDGGDHWLAAGFHRVAAFESKGRKRIPAEVHEGSLDDARWFAAASDKDHDRAGLYRSNEAKRAAVLLALNCVKSKTLSARQIAEHVGVSNFLVSEIKKTQVLESNTSNPSESPPADPPKVTGKDGKKYPATKPKKPKPANGAAPAPKPDPEAWWSCPTEGCGKQFNKHSAATRGWIQRGFCDDCEGEPIRSSPVATGAMPPLSGMQPCSECGGEHPLSVKVCPESRFIDGDSELGEDPDRDIEQEPEFVADIEAERAVRGVDVALSMWPPSESLQPLISSLRSKLHYVEGLASSRKKVANG